MGVKQYERHGASIYRTPRWKSLRFLARRRDGFKCVKCGAAGRLEVDHVRPLRTHPELAFDLDNLQSLCRPCHSRKTKAEVGFFTELDPTRQAWRNFVHELSGKEPQCSNPLNSSVGRVKSASRCPNWSARKS